MKRIIPDTNVLLRFLVGDERTQHNLAVTMFREAEAGKIELIILPIIVAEVCFVLNKFYKKTYVEIADAMESLLTPTWLEIEHKDSLRGMWGNYREGMHFVDSFILAIKKYESCDLFSFDKKLMRKSVI